MMCLTRKVILVPCYTTPRIRVINGSNRWVLCQPDQVNKTDSWPGGHEVLFLATSHYLPSHQMKMEVLPIGIGSCFTLIGAHQCGVLITDTGWLYSCFYRVNPVYTYTASETLVVSIPTGSGWQSKNDWALYSTELDGVRFTIHLFLGGSSLHMFSRIHGKRHK